MLHRLALGGLLAFALIAVGEHALEPQLEPGRHTISEYANADTGLLMTVGFLAWAASLLATAALAVDAHGRAREFAWTVLAALLTVAAAGLVLTACFATQTSAGVLPLGIQRSSSGQIHDVASLVAQVALTCAVVASMLALRGHTRFQVLAGGALALCVATSIVLLGIGDAVDGLRQRALVAVGCAWQGALIVVATRLAATTPSSDDEQGGRAR